MDFSIPDIFTTGVLNQEDLQFFYYDIGMDHLQQWSEVYNWESTISQVNNEIDIECCEASEIDTEFKPNRIQFTVLDKNNESKTSAFFRHLRNAFAHYHIVRKNENYYIIDISSQVTMRGMINADLLKRFCYLFFDSRENMQKIFDDGSM